MTDLKGDSFVAGDVLLEIETDKAQMDVEAQDNGILAKIIVPDGSQRVSVGKPIAILAEEGDDISSVQIPAEDTPAPQKPSEAAETTQKEQNPSRRDPTGHTPPLNFGNSYSPAVLRLLNEYGIEDPKSVTHSGPQGRLLKGDVLAHVGSISSGVVKSLQEKLARKQKLDLSNITVQRASEPLPLVVESLPKSRPALASVDTTVQVAGLLGLQQRLSG